MPSVNNKKKPKVSAPYTDKSARHLSCEGCRKRKMKCSRTGNCAACILRGEVCVWRNSAPSRTSEDATLEASQAEVHRLNKIILTLEARIARLEGSGAVDTFEDGPASEDHDRRNFKREKSSSSSIDDGGDTARPRSTYPSYPTFPTFPAVDYPSPSLSSTSNSSQGHSMPPEHHHPGAYYYRGAGPPPPPLHLYTYPPQFGPAGYAYQPQDRRGGFVQVSSDEMWVNEALEGMSVGLQ